MATSLDDLGARIRRARLARGLSLRATAGQAGVSPSLLSQVETGKVQPSVSTLYTLVTILDLSLDELLGVVESQGPQTAPQLRQPGESPVLPAGEGVSLVMENGVRWDSLASFSPGISPMVVSYEPGGASSVDDTQMKHLGVEYGYIIEGELTLKLGSESYLMRAGDSVCFDSRRSHLYINHTQGVTRGVWFVVGYNQGHDASEQPGGVRTAVDVLDEMNRQSFSS